MKYKHFNSFLALTALLVVGCAPTASSSSSSLEPSSSTSSSIDSSISSSSSSSSSSTFVELNTSVTDELEFDASYSGKSFDADAIGQVQLSACIDGDTATFREGDLRIRLRFIGINTPESTGKIDPWGKTASRFTCQKLSSAAEIVLENEVSLFGKFDNTGTRYLGWVWYRPSQGEPFRLLNLELVELAYSRNFMFISESKYFNQFREAQLKTENSNRRVYGEVDPSYDYSTTAQELTLKEIHDNFEEYEESGTKLRVEVLIQKFVGSNMFLRDIDVTEDEETAELDYGAIYAYAGYNSGLASFLRVGDIIQFYCRVRVFNGTRQITDIVSTTIGSQALLLKSRGNPITVEPVDATSDFSDYLGKIVEAEIEVHHLGSEDDRGNYTVYAKLVGTNVELNIRINSDIYPSYGNLFTIGNQYYVRGGLVEYSFEDDISYQILLGNNVGDSYADAYLLNN